MGKYRVSNTLRLTRSSRRFVSDKNTLCSKGLPPFAPNSAFCVISLDSLRFPRIWHRKEARPEAAEESSRDESLRRNHKSSFQCIICNNPRSPLLAALRFKAVCVYAVTSRRTVPTHWDCARRAQDNRCWNRKTIPKQCISGWRGTTTCRKDFWRMWSVLRKV